MTPIPVPASHVPQWQGLLDWHFASFAEREGVEPEKLWEDVKEKRRQLWVLWDNRPIAAVLTVVNMPRMVLTHAAGENRTQWLPFMEYLAVWGGEIGCDRLEAVARPGWERDLKKVGMKKTHVVMEKRL